MDSERDTLQPGTLIDEKYQILRPLGTGGMGSVYEALQIAIERKVALKLLHKQYVRDESVIERFQREARLAASIGHDNICEVTDFGIQDNGAPYLVMPVLKGYAFSDLLEEEPNLSLERIVDIICQTLSALNAAHNAGIVHRDLKPDNIFVTKFGDREDFVKLLDFGISKVIESDTITDALTRTGTIVGTPFYMSPEQARGEKEIDHRLDIYAVGVILYEACTGRRPFEGDTYNEIMFKIIAEPFASARNFRPEMNEAMEQVIAKAMAKKPDARYATALEMREACKDAMGLISSTSMSRTSARAAVSAGTGPFTPAAVSGVRPQTAAQTAAPTPISGPYPTDNSRADLMTTPVPGSSKKATFIGIGVAVLVVIVGIVVGVVLSSKDKPNSAVQIPLTAPVGEMPQPASLPTTTPPSKAEPPAVTAPAAPTTPPTAVQETESAEPKKESRVAEKTSDKKERKESSKRKKSKRRSKSSKSSESASLVKAIIEKKTEKAQEKPADKKEKKRIRGRANTYLIIDDD